MSKLIAPVIDLQYQRRFSLDVASVLENCGMEEKDEFTYTTRFSTSAASASAERQPGEGIICDGHNSDTFADGCSEDMEGKLCLVARVKEQLYERCPDEAEAVLKLLDETDWDCSFFVDCF